MTKRGIRSPRRCPPPFFGNVDIQMPTNVPHIFAIGDVVAHGSCTDLPPSKK